MLVNKQSRTTIMGRKSAMDWKYWGRNRPNWIQGIVEGAFEKVVEPKLKVALNTV